MSIQECHTAEDVRRLAQDAARRRKTTFAPAPKFIEAPLLPILKPIMAPVVQETRPSKFAPIIAQVADAFSISRETLLGGTDNQAISARRFAVALSVTRIFCAKQEIMDEFGVSDGTVKNALKSLEPILTGYAISSHSELSVIVPIIYKAWIDQTQIFPANYSISDVQKAFCASYGISLTELISPRRAKRICEPRQIAMAMAKHLTNRSFPEIGRRFGGRDHTTVLHANRKMQWLFDLIVPLMPEGAPLEAWVDIAKKYHEARP